jgi:hypothetical protein
MKLILKTILFFVVFLVVAILISRFKNAKDPTSCLYKKNAILRSVTKGAVGWYVPNCDIFGNYHSKQRAYTYYYYCVTRKGVNISKNPVPYTELTCSANSITDWLFYSSWELGLKILRSFGVGF